MNLHVCKQTKGGRDEEKTQIEMADDHGDYQRFLCISDVDRIHGIQYLQEKYTTAVCQDGGGQSAGVEYYAGEEYVRAD